MPTPVSTGCACRRNACRDKFHSVSCGSQVSLDEHIRDHGEMVLGADASTPDRELTRKEIGTRLKAAIQNLPFEQRTALVLREVEGLKYEEIAFSLGLPVGTVKSRLTRARQALRVELGDLRC